jgi:hypothetical protein
MVDEAGGKGKVHGFGRAHCLRSVKTGKVRGASRSEGKTVVEDSQFQSALRHRNITKVMIRMRVNQGMFTGRK